MGLGTSSPHQIGPEASVNQPSAAPVMPVLTLPKLPKLTPGKPLDPEQRQELVKLQQQIQAQLQQQRLLVDSIRQLPQFAHMAAPSLGESDPSAQAFVDAEFLRSLQHMVGPDPVGDTPAADLESEEDARTASDGQNRDNDDKISSSTLGTTTKVYVDFSGDASSIEKKELAGGLLELDELLRRGGAAGDTGEPSIASPRSSVGVDHFEKSSEHSASGASKTSRQSVPSASKHSKRSLNSPKAAEEEINREVLSQGDTKRIGGPNPITDQQSVVEKSVASKRPMPSPPPLKDRPQAITSTVGCLLKPADPCTIGTSSPGREERRLIEAAVRRMFKFLVPATLEAITESFREWKLPPCTAIVKQGTRVSTGPGLCVLLEGVVDVLNKPLGSQDSEKVCTYDRCGQCFGELELFYNVPRGEGAGRKLHWATIASRTPATLWVIPRETLKSCLSDNSSTQSSCESSEKDKEKEADTTCRADGQMNYV